MSEVRHLVNALFKVEVLLLMMLFIPVLVLASCAVPVEEDQPAAATFEPTALECEELPDDARQLCVELVALRVSNYDVFLERHRARLEPAQLARAEARVYEAIALSPQILSHRGPHTTVICEVRDVGRVDCISLASLLAIYDAEMGELILSDISRLYEVFGFDPAHELLFACGPGLWGAADLTQFGSPDISQFLGSVTAEVADQMIDICAKVQASMGDGASSLANAGGFSGVTGFDPLGLSSICGMEISGGPGSFDRFMELATNMLEAFRENCEPSFLEGLMEGDDSTGDVVDDSGDDAGADVDNAQDADSYEVIIPNGDGTEWVCTEHGCYVRYSSETSSKYPTASCAAAAGCSCSGSDTDCTNSHFVETPDGWVVATVTMTEDGTLLFHVDHLDGQEYYGITAPDGNQWLMDCFGSYCRDVSAPPGQDLPDAWEPEDVLKYWEEKYRNPGNRWITRAGECLDETCQTCVDYAAFNPRMMDDCLQSGGASYACRAFSREADCCSNPDAFPGDPRLVIPNPEGDFVCMGGADPDLKAETCETMCSVAEREDCYSNCMSRGLAVIDISPLDLVCRYAMSEACFSSQGGIPVPEHPGPWIGGPEPIPQPAAALVGVAVEHLVLPPIEPRGPGGPTDQ